MRYATSYFIVPPGGLRSGQTLNISRPAGVSAAQIAGAGHSIGVVGSIYSAPTHFTVANVTAIGSGTVQVRFST